MSKKNVINRCCVLLMFLLLAACGQMKIKESHYYAIENNDNTNVFRLKVRATSVLGDAKYQSGWYPANAVDSLYGNVRSNGGQADLQARQEIETEIRKAIILATKNYNTVALDPKSTEADIQKAMQIKRNVLAYPALWVNMPENSRIIDYNPSKGVVIKHSDEKMVFVLSSNPDAVIGNIKNFAESDKTALAVSHLAKVTSQRVRNEIVADEARESIERKAIEIQLKDSITLLENADAADKDKIEDQIKLLIEFLEGVN